MRTMFSMVLAAAVGLTFGGFALAEEGEVGPHKGPVAEWGEEEYHLEVVADAKTGDVLVYVYGGHKDLDKGKTKPLAAKTITLSLKTTEPATTRIIFDATGLATPTLVRLSRGGAAARVTVEAAGAVRIDAG